MEVKVQSSKLVKPAFIAAPPREHDEYVPLSVFDTVTYQMQMAIIYAFPPPAPSTAAIEKGLAAVLAEYRTFAGQIRVARDGSGTPAVLLNDHGARIVEATVDANFVDLAPAKPTPELLLLHPDIEQELQEVVLLQLTRFRCGSLAIGFTSNHVAADGHATSNFLVACRLPCTTSRASSSRAPHPPAASSTTLTTAAGSTTTCRRLLLTTTTATATATRT